MPTRLSLVPRRTRVSPDPTVPLIVPSDIVLLPGSPLIDDASVSPRRIWSSERVAAAIAEAGGGGGTGSVFLATAVSGTANAITLTVPGLVLSAAPVLIQFDPESNNTGAVTISVNGSATVALVSRLGLALAGDELIAPVPALIRISTVTAKIVSGSI